MNKPLSARWLSLLLCATLLAACTPAAPPTPTALPATAVPTQRPPTATPPPPTATSQPPTATATAVPPTATASEVPPTATETPIPDPVVIHADEVAADGCPVVALHPAAWAPLHASYDGGSDPLFLFHTKEKSFFFAAELYTVYGAGWTGELGTFATDCTKNGICIYLVPILGQRYLATVGEIDIVALAQTAGTLDFPVEFTLRDLTLMPVPGSGSEGCYHVEAVTILLETAPTP